MKIKFILLNTLIFNFLSVSLVFSETQTLWDNWYTVTSYDQVHYSYYNEKIKTDNNQIIYQMNLWKKEEGIINKENLTVYSKNDQKITPLNYHFFSNYRDSELNIEGKVTNDSRIHVTINKTNEVKTQVNKHIPKSTFFSVFFPIWIKKNLTSIQTKKIKTFYTIFEDNISLNFKSIVVEVRVEPNDNYANKTNTLKLSVIYEAKKAYWWVKKSGEPLKIFLPHQKIMIEKVPENIALQFLK